LDGADTLGINGDEKICLMAVDSRPHRLP